VQRLFSTFPNGWPGGALLLMRLVVAAPLFWHSIAFICGFTNSVPALELLALACAVLLAVGLCTPLAALAEAALEVWLAVRSGTVLGDHVTLAAIGISLCMLGPGAWSLDAHLFGRKRIKLNSDRD
jgi:putative oxidoreductase